VPHIWNDENKNTELNHMTTRLLRAMDVEQSYQIAIRRSGPFCFNVKHDHRILVRL